MGVTPEFRVTANSADITAAIADRLISLRVMDEFGFQSDKAEITLADYDPENPINKPPKGAELEVFLGYDGSVKRMGLFVADEIGISGWPGVMTISAHAAPYESTPKGKKDLQTQKTRAWPDKTKLGAMVQKIAKEHGMAAVVAKSLAGVVLPHFSQTAESDISFLVRVTRTYDAVVKPSGGKLVLAKRGESQTASGEEMPTITLDASDCTSFDYTESARDDGGTVVAFWHSKGMAKRKQISVGSGEPVKQIRHHYPNEAAAKAAAQGELDKRQRGKCRLGVSMPGNTDVQAEAKLTLTGFRAGIPTEWLIKRAEHDFQAGDGGGYKCHVEAELPDGDDSDTPDEGGSSAPGGGEDDTPDDGE